MDDVVRPGTLLRDGRYEILELLRARSSKEIYLALDRVVGRRVALDVFSNNFVMPGGMTVRAWEAQVLARLRDHPNVATVLDHWEDEHVAAMVTRYLTGGSLLDRIEEAKRESGEGLAIEDVFRLSIELAYGLAHIHSCGILYRDLQPRNVLFDEWGTLHLVDFDTAVLLIDQDMSDMSSHSVVNYMAPEIIAKATADERADLYSLGASIYEMVAGRPAFAGNRERVLAAHRAGPPASLDREGLPEGLAGLILSLLAPDRDDRPRRADEVAGCLEKLRATHAKIQRLLKSSIDHEVLKTLAEFLDVEASATARSRSGADTIGVTFAPNIDLPPDHRLLMQAIMALAESDYRRAAIDAGTASEVALASSIDKLLRTKGLNDEFINQTVRRANGLEGLFSEYISLGNPLPLCRNVPITRSAVIAQLAGIRNGSAHAGHVPTAEEAARAVELAHSIVITVHPYQ
jgi:eukaryotic-like serine/threonine-protein kinase